ncbi:MAG TPA: amidohydrolase family protein [Burkholderiales bacterium]|nr:amidohydrolase family protein [Burkholderiales bacterium]
MAECLIVDAQVHIWAASSPARPWPARHEPHRPEPITKDDLLREMAVAGVDRAVLVPPSWEGERNDIVLAAARAHPDRFSVMGRLDPEAPESRAALRNWRAQPGMLGLRFTFHRPSLQPLLTEGRVDWVWAEAERAGVPVMMTCPYAIIHLADEIAARHPGLRLTIDHLGLLPKTRDEEAFRDFDKLLALARRPNIAVKASALPCYTSDTYPYRRLHTYIKRAIDAFGARRVFWGTDLSRLPCSYREAATMFTEEMPWLGSEEKSWIMGRGLCEWLDWSAAGS